MPMYEFYCHSCNTIYTFFSKTVNTEKTPDCPACKTSTLTRQVSRFSFTGSSRKDQENDSEFPDLPIDESKMERAMQALASEAENINEDDPRQAANLMRKLTDMTGLKLGDKMEDALSRMEAGEDPEAIEQQLGDIDESDLFKLDSAKSSRQKRPVRDETLYEM
jgi:putative FmdB family regulatory protein